jgi:methylmalonyl-CoA carboxyltransferase 12S subunit
MNSEITLETEPAMNGEIILETERAMNGEIVLETERAMKDAISPGAGSAGIEGEITPELLMVMSASIAAYLGKNIRIRRARFIDPLQLNAWGQSSRVVVQSSHYLKR